MGVDLSDIIPHTQRQLSDFSGKTMAIDAYNTLYQFLATIRQPDGTPLMDREGRITSHLSGLLYRTASIIESGIRPVYVFDGKPPAEKKDTIKARSAIRQKAWEEWQMAKEAGDMEKAKSKAQQSSRLTKDMAGEAKQLLMHMGVPYVQAPSEGEAQACHMALKGDVWAAASQDFDSLLFGTPFLVRNLTITGRRKLPRKNVYVDVAPEEIQLEAVLKELGVSREQLVDMAILVGTDFNPGVKGIGPKKSLKLLKEYGTLEKVIEEKEIEVEGYQETREIFLDHKVTDEYELEWAFPSTDNIKSFLCEGRGFSETRVSSALKRMEKGAGKRSQQSLDSWF